MTEQRKGLSAGVIAAIASGVIASGGGAVAAYMLTQGNKPAESPATVNADEPAVGIQSVPAPDSAAPPPPLAPMQPGAVTLSPDGSISFIDETLTFSATFPKGPETDPILKALRADTLAQLEKRKPEARADFEDRKKQGAMELSWEVQVEWRYTAQAGGIASLVGTQYEFTGGAHGMTSTGTQIARMDTGEELPLSKMLMSDRWPSPALTIAICEALKTAKLKTIQSATIYDEPIICAGPRANVKIEDANIAFAPSTEPDKFGGMFVYYDAYAVGSYAEGSYELAIPQSVFSEDMRPTYKPLFGGTIPANATP